MKISSRMLSTLIALALAICFASSGRAQNRERHIISAKAGSVNSVIGRVILARVGLEPQLLTAQDDLAAGDTVTTDSGSQAEILLNPGSYLRLGENSVLTLADTSLDNLLVKMKSGSVIIEATGPDDAKFQINVATDRERLAIVRSGIYRINVTAEATELLVRKGRVLLPDGQLVKGGKKVTLSRGSSVIVKLEKTDTDSFDLWSKQRAETLAQANRKLSNRVLNGYLSNNSFWDWGFSTWSRWGLWTYSPFSRCYTFLPFYYGWSSPYGNYYGNYFNSYYFRRFPSGSSGVPVIVSHPPSSGGGSGGSPVVPGNTRTGAGTSGPSGPFNRAPSQPGPRDRESGGRVNNRVRDP
jgi:hypothetical protein